MNIPFTLLLMTLISASGVRSATPDPFRKGLDLLKTAIEDLGQPLAGEVASEISGLESLRVQFERQASEINVHRTSIDSEQERLDRINRERDSQLWQIETDQKAYDNDIADMGRRLMLHNADALAQHVAAEAATTPAEVASSRAWGEVVNARKKAFKEEGKRLDERSTGIQRRQSDIASDIIGHAQRANWLGKRLILVDRETSRTLGEIAAALSHALALKQIADHPARAAAYESPDALAHRVASGFFSSFAKEAALKGLESRGSKAVLNQMGGEVLVKLLAKIGLEGSPPGLVFTVADTFADVAIAGVDQRTNEVTKNLFLIGDYGEVMKQMIQTEGKSATQTPEYMAMRAEIEHLAAEMPSNDAQVLLQGLNSSAALGTALVAAAGNYIGGKTERSVHRSTDAWLQSKYKTWGPGMVRFFRGGIKSTANAVGDESVKQSAGIISDSFRRATEPVEP